MTYSILREEVRADLRLDFCVAEDVALPLVDRPSRTHWCSVSGMARRAIPIFSRSLERCSKYIHILLPKRQHIDKRGRWQWASCTCHHPNQRLHSGTCLPRCSGRPRSETEQTVSSSQERDEDGSRWLAVPPPTRVRASLEAVMSASVILPCRWSGTHFQ